MSKVKGEKDLAWQKKAILLFEEMRNSEESIIKLNSKIRELNDKLLGRRKENNHKQIKFRNKMQKEKRTKEFDREFRLCNFAQDFWTEVGKKGNFFKRREIEIDPFPEKKEIRIHIKKKSIKIDSKLQQKAKQCEINSLKYRKAKVLEKVIKNNTKTIGVTLIYDYEKFIPLTFTPETDARNIVEYLLEEFDIRRIDVESEFSPKEKTITLTIMKNGLIKDFSDEFLEKKAKKYVRHPLSFKEFKVKQIKLSEKEKTKVPTLTYKYEDIPKIKLKPDPIQKNLISLILKAFSLTRGEVEPQITPKKGDKLIRIRISQNQLVISNEFLKGIRGFAKDPIQFKEIKVSKVKNKPAIIILFFHKEISSIYDDLQKKIEGNNEEKEIKKEFKAIQVIKDSIKENNFENVNTTRKQKELLLKISRLFSKELEIELKNIKIDPFPKNRLLTICIKQNVLKANKKLNRMTKNEEKFTQLVEKFASEPIKFKERKFDKNELKLIYVHEGFSTSKIQFDEHQKRLIDLILKKLFLKRNEIHITTALNEKKEKTKLIRIKIEIDKKKIDDAYISKLQNLSNGLLFFQDMKFEIDLDGGAIILDYSLGKIKGRTSKEKELNGIKPQSDENKDRENLIGLAKKWFGNELSIRKNINFKSLLEMIIKRINEEEGEKETFLGKVIDSKFHVFSSKLKLSHKFDLVDMSRMESVSPDSRIMDLSKYKSSFIIVKGNIDSGLLYDAEIYKS